MAVPGEERVGCVGAGGAGGVVGEGFGGRRIPGVEQGLHELPALVDKVGVLEEGHIAGHGVVEQALVALAVIAEGAGRKLEVDACPARRRW